MLPTVTDAIFTADVREADRPVLVEFPSPTCGPCRQIAADRPDLRVVTLDITTNPHHCRTRRHRYPTLILFYGGEERSRSVGAKPHRLIEGDLGLMQENAV